MVKKELTDVDRVSIVFNKLYGREIVSEEDFNEAYEEFINEAKSSPFLIKIKPFIKQKYFKFKEE